MSKQKTPELKTITTPNMLEIAYLLDRRHRITGVTTQAGWPYGIEELAVTLEGENIDLDHMNFMRHGEFKMHRLPQVSKAFAAVMTVIDRQADDAAYAGGA
jgi:hypothetical protein